MKQYLSPDQTAKLIELGFEKPKNTFTFKLIEHNDVKTDIDIPVSNYSIGELIEMLPREYNGETLEILAVQLTYSKWTVRYPYGIIINKKELIDALFDMLVKLKEVEMI